MNYKNSIVLDRLINDYLKTEFYKLRFVQDGGSIKFVFDSLHQPDKSVNAVIGDVISNLRSALDYAVVPLVLSKKEIKSSVFPFGDDKANFKGEVNKAWLASSSQAIREHFISEIQAYKGGKGHALWVLNKLRNIDKHRFLVATTSLAGVTASWIDKISRNRCEDCSVFVDHGNSCVFFEASGDYQIEFTKGPSPNFVIRLDEKEFVPEQSDFLSFNDLANQPLIKFLKDLALEVSRVINAIESVYKK